MKILIVASSKLPVPAVKGGAVPTLIEELIKQNEIQREIELYCCSLYDEEAKKAAEKYGNTKFIWAKVPNFFAFMDKVFYFVLSNCAVLISLQFVHPNFQFLELYLLLLLLYFLHLQHQHDQ